MSTRLGKVPVFISRDGYLLERVYSSYFGKCHYLYFSRRVASSLVFSVTNLDIDIIKRLIYMHRFVGTLGNFCFLRLPSKFKPPTGWDYDRELNSEITSDFNYIISFIESNISEIRQSSKIDIRGFRQSLKCLPKPDDWMLIDLGVFGTNQFVMSKILNVDLVGLYLCGSSVNPWRISDYYYVLDFESSSYRNWSALLECFLTAPHGTTIGFGPDGDPKFGRSSLNVKRFYEVEDLFREIYGFIQSRETLSVETLIREAVYFADNLSTYLSVEPELENMLYLENDFVRPLVPEKKIDIVKRC